MAIDVRHVYRSKNIIGMTVKNEEGANVGTIEEVVVDLDTNKLCYAALSFGGVMGFGSKLFAVPWSCLLLRHDEAERYFQFNVNPEQLASAPGFDKDNWPEEANRHWIHQDKLPVASASESHS